MRRKNPAGDLLGNFEKELERRRRQIEQSLPEIFTGKLVEREIAAHRREDSSVLPQAFRFERLFRETAAAQVVRPVVDLAQPPFILPGTGSDVDLIGGQA